MHTHPAVDPTSSLRKAKLTHSLGTTEWTKLSVAYEIIYQGPTSTRIEVRVHCPPTSSASLDLVLPSWVPGSYVIRDPARHVIRALREDPQGAPTIPVSRISKSRWRVPCDGTTPPVVRFELFAFELTKLGVDTTADHLFVNAAFALPYVDGRLHEPCEVSLRIPAEWTVVTELKEVERGSRRYAASSYDELVDSPIDCGPIQEWSVRPAGIPHRIAVCGTPVGFDRAKVERDVEQIVATTIAYFGNSPLHHYTFFYHLAESSEGGLEHATSNSCVIARDTASPAKKYRRFLHLTAHEYFHLYNVKRIRPAVLGPFDYTRETYTRLLWWMEGTTDYVSHLLLRRSGLLTPAQYLEDLADMIRRYRETPGRSVISLEESSLSAWVGFYKPSDESLNQWISYYLKGALVSWGLDMEIRAATRNASSLDTVLRFLWREYGERGKGIEETEMPRVVEQATGIDRMEFFQRFVAGTDELDIDLWAKLAGLRVDPAPREETDDTVGTTGHLGIDLAVAEGIARVKSVRDGTPARIAGLRPGDELIGLDGRRIYPNQWTETIENLLPGREVELLIFRRGLELRRQAMVAPAPPKKLILRSAGTVSESERAIHQSWLQGSILPPVA
jgi:predicted metalloprotease with PDZ domain